MTTVSLEISKHEGKNNFYFTIQLTAKTSFLVTLTGYEGNQLFIEKLNTPFVGGNYFANTDAAISHYKNKKMKAALAFLPEYIANGMTGEITI